MQVFYVLYEMVAGDVVALYAMSEPLNCALAVAQLTAETGRDFGCYVSAPWSIQ